MINIIKPKLYKKMHGNTQGICYLDDDNNPVIELPYHASTKTKLHEMAHKELGHVFMGDITYRELFDGECDAEMFVRKHINKIPDINIVLPAIYGVCAYGYIRPNVLLNLSRDYLDNYGIKFSKDDISRLWNTIKREYKAGRN